MRGTEVAHLELLAEVDAWTQRLTAWSQSVPDWPAAHSCQAIVRRLCQRADSLRIRLEAPLVVGLLGGTGSGKSTLVNALAGAEVTLAGRQRPTTRLPVLVCRPGLTPQMLGIDPADVQWQEQDLPALRDLVLLDCPDPDTTEDPADAGANLARLRKLLPFCDVLLVTATQQKYRSARVAEELAGAATGARLVFVQTHADRDADIREDWRQALAEDYPSGPMFLVDSQAALADARAGLQPRGDFARLRDLLTRELTGAASLRIRRANFLDLAEEALRACCDRWDAALPAVQALESALAEQRARLAARLSAQMREELLTNRRQWEGRLVGEVAARWGYSPFSLVLRGFQGLGGLLTGGLLLRARTPAQLALWGAMEGGRHWKRRSEQQAADDAASRAVVWSWDEAELRTAAIIVEGYTADAGLPRQETRPEAMARAAAAAGDQFIARTAGDLQAILQRLAARHSVWWVRGRYELALLLLLGLLLYRLGKNFFYDAWLAAELGWRETPAAVLGVEFLVQALFWLLAWCGLLLWAFTHRLRRGLHAEIDRLAAQWNAPAAAPVLFQGLEEQCRDIRRARQDLDLLLARAAELRDRLALPEAPRPGRLAE